MKLLKKDWEVEICHNYRHNYREANKCVGGLASIACGWPGWSFFFFGQKLHDYIEIKGQGPNHTAQDWEQVSANCATNGPG